MGDRLATIDMAEKRGLLFPFGGGLGLVEIVPCTVQTYSDKMMSHIYDFVRV